MPSRPDDSAFRRFATGSRLLSMPGAALAGLVAVVIAFAVRSEAPVAAEKDPALKSGFVASTAEQRLAAIGKIDSLPAPMRRAFQPGSDFVPMTTPLPGQWLAEHVESGQTFDAFVASKPNRPDGKRNRIYLLPLGDFDGEWSPKLADLSDVATAFFQLEVRVLPGIAIDGKLVKSRTRGDRTQYLSTDFLNVLRTQLPADAYCIIGVTMQDLYPQESWNYVFGQASLRDRVGVYSFARYDPQFWGQKRTPDSKRLLLSRSCGVLVHETSHMFGMQHCIYFECVVNGSNSLEESDEQPLHLCPVCLRKLQSSVGFDVVKRYQALRDVYRKIGLEDEADWINRRLAIIAGPEPAKAPR